MLDRLQIDGLVRELGPDVYGLALARGAGAQQSKALVLEAFGEVARDFPHTSVEVLRRKLYVRIKARDHGDLEREVAISPVQMPADLRLGPLAFHRR